MPYKVFLVEDEVVTREGIRNNVDWKANGFEFCGEAADGEMALPLLRTAQPDVLITDIKMPFMDGLQLSKIVRERMPWVKVVILSGHDEFEYAQEAISLGVTEYLLKPVTVQKLHSTLQKLAVQLNQEKEEQDNIKKLQEQVEESRATLCERLLLKLVVGAVSPTEAIEKGQTLGLDLIARYYLVVIMKIELVDRSEQYDYEEILQGQRTVIGLAEQNPDIFLLRRDWGDLIMIMKGSTEEFITEERDFFLQQLKKEISQTRYRLAVGIGSPKKRIADVCQSFVEALVSLQTPVVEDSPGLDQAVERAELLKVNQSAVDDFLRFGVKRSFREFFDEYIRPLGANALKSNLIKNYIFVDLVLAAAKLVNELEGNIEEVIPELNTIESILTKINTVEQLRDQAEVIISNAIDFRDSLPNGQYKVLVRQAKEYIEQQFSNPDLSLGDVAARANLSVSHFSVVFSQVTGQTFKEYLTEIRMHEAKKLLRTTSLRAANIAYQVGYNDPHYFSSVFKKNTGFSPIEFRSQV